MRENMIDHVRELGRVTGMWKKVKEGMRVMRKLLKGNRERRL